MKKKQIFFVCVTFVIWKFSSPNRKAEWFSICSWAAKVSILQGQIPLHRWNILCVLTENVAEASDSCVVCCLTDPIDIDDGHVAFVVNLGAAVAVEPGQGYVLLSERKSTDCQQKHYCYINTNKTSKFFQLIINK